MGLLAKMFKMAFKPTINNVKGAIGERKVNAKLNPVIFDKVEHRQINNLVLLDENGTTHQIDHVEIRQNGIFCIETKNLSGWIFGNATQDMWTQTLYNEKHKFLNPVKQNRSHIYHIRKTLDDKYKVNSIIVMAQNNADRIDIPYVINLKDLNSYLKDYNDGTFYSIEEMDRIYQALTNVARTDISRRDHVANIHKAQENVEEGVCPRCGKRLALREGSYGKFYGCTGYPNCKYTKNI